VTIVTMTQQTGGLESQVLIGGGKVQTLSDQQLVSCDIHGRVMGHSFHKLQRIPLTRECETLQVMIMVAVVECTCQLGTTF